MAQMTREVILERSRPSPPLADGFSIEDQEFYRRLERIASGIVAEETYL
jgi:hypothetical protein